MPRTIDKVIDVVQHDHTVYTFPLPAKLLIALARIERFGQDKDGVNRQLNQGHAEDIAVAMSTKSAPVLWLEPIIGDLRGSWIFQAGVMLVGDDAYISVDDGQHRVFALQCGLLTEAEISELVFMVTATMGLPYETRLRIFRMQTERRQIDARLDLAQRNHLGDWATPLDQEAYQLVLELASHERSPLKGRIQLDEAPQRPYEKGSQDEPHINARGLYASLRTIIGRRSPLHQLLPAKRAEVIMDMIQTAAVVWEGQWNSPKHILTTARGINAMLMLMVSGTNFRSQVGIDFSPDNIRRGLELGASFDWGLAKARNQSVRAITERLDQSMGRALQKAVADRSRRQPAVEATSK